MELLSLQKAGIIAWSNSKRNNCLFATAEYQESNHSNGILQIYGFDMMNKNSSSNCLGKSRYDKGNFTSIAWDVFGETNNYSLGIIAGGMANGFLTLWDPNAITQYATQKHGILDDVDSIGLLCEVQLANNSIHSLEFNPQKPNLIACGGDELIIADISEAIDNPNFFSPGETNMNEGSLISCVTWNKKISHILASASQNGVTSIWDLKVKESIFNFSDNSDSNQQRRVQVTWNPEIPTQLAVAYDDEKYPELQIWDLRNPQGPITSIPAHTKGIHNIDWCISDPSLILTAGRDNKIFMWNYKTCEMVSENNNITDDLNQVIWSPKLPDIYSASTIDGDVKVFTLNSDAQVETNLSNYAPKWLKPPVAARFSFDGRLITFSEKMGSVINEYYLQDTNKDIDALVTEFEDSLNCADISELCDKKLSSHKLDEKDKLEWGFIKVIKTEDSNELIKILGFNKNDIIKQSEQYTGKTHRKKEEEIPTGTKLVRTTINFTKISEEEADSFFANLRAPKDKQEKKDQKGANKVPGQNGVEKEHIIAESLSKNINWNAGIEKLIKLNILVGNIEGAVDCALKCGRVAEALTLAYTLGPDYFLSTVKTHFTASKEFFLKSVINNLVETDLEDLIQSYSLNDWKECVALIATQSKGHEFRELMNKLADRFSKEKKDDIHTVLLYILAKNSELAAEVYMHKYLTIPKNSSERLVYLIRTFEKILALKNICNIKYNWANFDTIVFELAQLLTQYGRYELALRILVLGDTKNLGILRLRDRLFHCRNDFAHEFNPIQFPYEMENIGHKSLRTRQIPKTDGITGQAGSKPITGQYNPKNVIGASPIPDNRTISGPPITNITSQLKPPVNVGFNNSLGNKQVITGPPIDSNLLQAKRTDSTQLTGNQTNITSNPFTNPPPVTNPIFNKPIPGPIGSFGSTSTGTDSNLIKHSSIPGPLTQAKTEDKPLNTPLDKKAALEKTLGKSIPPPNPFMNKATSGHTETNQPDQGLSSQLAGKANIGNLGMGAQTQVKDIHQGPPPIKSTAPISRQLGPMPKPVTNTSNVGQPPINAGNVMSGPIKQAPVQYRATPNPITKLPGPTMQNTISSGPSNTKSPKELFDISQIPSAYKSIADTIMSLLPILDLIEKNPIKKNDAESKLNQLFIGLANSTLNNNILKNLNQLCQEMQKGNENAALICHQNMMKDDDWNNNKEWLMVLKRLITKKQSDIILSNKSINQLWLRATNNPKKLSKLTNSD